MSKIEKKSKNSFIAYVFLAAFISSLCCFSPIVFVLFGLATVSTAAYWGNYFFFGFWWLFIAVGLFFIALMLLIYWRKKQICTLDDVKRHRRKIINSVLLSLSLFIVFYVAIEMLWEFIWIKMGLTSWEEFRKLFGS